MRHQATLVRYATVLAYQTYIFVIYIELYGVLLLDVHKLAPAIVEMSVYICYTFDSV